MKNSEMKNAGNGKARRNGGFTLIELIVVITIVGLLAWGGVRIYSQYINDARFAQINSTLGEIKGIISQTFTKDFTASDGTNVYLYNSTTAEVTAPSATTSVTNFISAISNTSLGVFPVGTIKSGKVADQIIVCGTSSSISDSNNPDMGATESGKAQLIFVVETSGAGTDISGGKCVSAGSTTDLGTTITIHGVIHRYKNSNLTTTSSDYKDAATNDNGTPGTAIGNKSSQVIGYSYKTKIDSTYFEDGTNNEDRDLY